MAFTSHATFDRSRIKCGCSVSCKGGTPVKALLSKTIGAPESLVVGHVSDPVPGDDEILDHGQGLWRKFS